jgi:membrane protease YdiL (CAAX protease family)
MRAVALGLITGLSATLTGVYAYSVIARANLRFAPTLPWGAVVGAVGLWCFWRYLGGHGWPRRTSAYRLRMRRAFPVPRPAMPAVAASCMAGSAFVLSAMTLAFRFMQLPADALRILPTGVDLPLWSAVPALFVLALVAGVCEEVGIRGYLQRSIEEVSSPSLAILASALVFTLLHANRDWFLAQAVPMFIAGCWYGYLTYATRSILPMIVVHTLLDLSLFVHYELLRAPLPAPLTTSGVGAAFWANTVMTVSTGVATLALTQRAAQRVAAGV